MWKHRSEPRILHRVFYDIKIRLIICKYVKAMKLRYSVQILHEE